MTLKDTTNWVDVTFLPDTPGYAIAITLLIIAFYAAYAGLWSITVCTGLLFPFVLLCEMFLTISNIPFKNYHFILPVLEHGMEPVLHGLVYTTNGIVEVVIVLLFQHRIRGQFRFSTLIIILVTTAYLVIVPLLDTIASFSASEAAKLRFPIFEQWGLITLGKNINHLDFLSIFEWLSGSFVRLSLCIYLLVELFQVKKTGFRKLTFLVIAVLLLMVPFYQISDPLFIWMMQRIFYPLSLALIVFVVLLLFVLSVIIRLKEKGSQVDAG
ncbi:hypothetical protein EJC50_17060 [Paenibacillus albus]|uniref:Uncharacterized protein n=1 Tax=Paenibacillus albus TaxID=2495582 RepID=A0A3Q8X8C5_9BACL|nr:hypothetical protein EJC50_17060 [Paenibacillus albus]